MSRLCRTPEPPYYAAIFASERTEDAAGYAETFERMHELARGIDGFLGFEAARGEIGISVSYWRDLEAIARWREHAEHRQAQAEGRRRWYSAYTLRIARVERQGFHERG